MSIRPPIPRKVCHNCDGNSGNSNAETTKKNSVIVAMRAEMQSRMPTRAAIPILTRDLSPLKMAKNRRRKEENVYTKRYACFAAANMAWKTSVSK